MARVECQQLLPRDGVAEVIFGGSRRVAFSADPEQLRLDGVELELGVNRFRKDPVERLGKAFARACAVGGNIFVSIRNPDVRHGRRFQLPAHFSGNSSAGNAVRNPEFPDCPIRMGQRESVGRLRMGKVGGVKVKS